MNIYLLHVNLHSNKMEKLNFPFSFSRGKERKTEIYLPKHEEKKAIISEIIFLYSFIYSTNTC